VQTLQRRTAEISLTVSRIGASQTPGSTVGQDPIPIADRIQIQAMFRKSQAQKLLLPPLTKRRWGRGSLSLVALAAVAAALLLLHCCRPLLTLPLPQLLPRHCQCLRWRAHWLVWLQVLQHQDPAQGSSALHRHPPGVCTAERITPHVAIIQKAPKLHCTLMSTAGLIAGLL